MVSHGALSSFLYDNLAECIAREIIGRRFISACGTASCSPKLSILASITVREMTDSLSPQRSDPIAINVGDITNTAAYIILDTNHMGNAFSWRACV